ncbi:MAG: type II toxin-antitoxin system VapC family toxin [Candidatus Hinthialibacter antarcticus]|nr:type II toxin-antitoxin system VapC family toxin [Candidatus Hinthialibacter antarcticus]
MLDTNIASFMIRGGNPNIRKRLNRVPLSNVCVSVITQAELLYGIELKPEAINLKNLVREFLLRPAILPWDERAAIEYAVLCASLARAGTPMGNLDTMIASHALSVNATLVTNDNSFSRVVGLKVKDWSK